MAEDIFNLRTKISMDTVDFESSMQEVERSIKKTRAEMKLTNADLKLYDRDSGSLTNRLKLLARAEEEHQVKISQTRDKFREVQADYKTHGNTLDNNSKKMDALIATEAKEKASLANIRTEMNLLNTEILRSESGFIQMGDKLVATGTSIRNVGTSMDGVANAWMRVSGIVAAVGGVLVGTTIQWESSVASMAKTIDATPAEFDMLTDSIRDMALEVPMSASSLAELAATAGQLGIETPKIAEFTETVAAMGVSTNITAQDAASAFARIANITGMSQGDFDRVGSSIVELGNNFATTESEITDMTLRLAGAGTTVGLSEPDILGMAAALSSLGIEAESGGSSMSKLMVEMQLATAEGGDYLLQFANVAGTSAEEFTTAFQNDPISAITMFVEGLGKVDAAGGSSIETLDLMGISEIRMRDALLRLANGSDILSSAVQTSNTAWEENTALQVEADKRYATTESQLLLLKNKLMEVAISAGEQLLPALNSIIDSLDPMIESLSDGVKWFANLDNSTKEATLKLAGFVIMGAPVLKGLAGITKALGTGVKGFGNLSLGIGETIVAGLKASNSASGLTTSITTMGAGASASTGGLSALLTGLTTTAGGALVLVGAMAGVGIALLDMKLKYDDSKRQTEIWGDDLDQKTIDALESFQTFSLEVNNELDKFNSGLTTSADEAIAAYDNMIVSLQKQGAEAKEAIVESFDHLPERLQAKLQETLDKRVTHIDELILEATTAEQKITEVLTTAESERRALTEGEQSRIQALQAQIASVQAELAAENAEQQKKILGNLTTEIDNLNRQQLSSHYDMLVEKRTLEKENYEESLASLEEWKDELTDTEYMNYLDEINRKYNVSNQDLLASQVATLSEMGANDSVIEALLEGSGMTYAEAMARYAEITGQSKDGIIETTDEVSKAVDDANRTWNSMILDPISGEVNTNVGEVAKVASESEKGWNDLKFALKHADMDTNTKEQIKQALIENGKWNELTFEEQQAILSTTAKESATEFMKASGLWANLNPDEIRLWMSTNSTAAKDEFMATNGIWDALSPEQKELLMNTNSFDISQEFLEANGIWEKLSPEQQNLIMNTNAYATMEDFLKTYGLWDQLDPEMKEYITSTNAESTQVKFDGASRAFEEMNPGVKEFNVRTNALQIIAEVQAAINGLKDTDVYVDTVANRVYTTASATGQQQAYAQGTNFHSGGYAILGDGGRKEPFLTPAGRFGVSPNTDTMYNLPRGSKVWSSIQKFKSQASNNDYLKSFMSQLPKFAMGTQKSFLDSPKMPNVFAPSQSVSQPIVNVYQTISSPDPIDARESARLSKINMQNLGYMLSRG